MTGEELVKRGSRGRLGNALQMWTEEGDDAADAMRNLHEIMGRLNALRTDPELTTPIVLAKPPPPGGHVFTRAPDPAPAVDPAVAVTFLGVALVEGLRRLTQKLRSRDQKGKT